MVCVMLNKLVTGRGQVASEASRPEEMRHVIDWYAVVTRELWAGYGMLGLLKDPAEEGLADTCCLLGKRVGQIVGGGVGLADCSASTLSYCTP